MKRILLMGLVLMLTFLHGAVAQTRSLSGRVIDRGTNEGLPGVTVLLKGTSNGASTNSDGGFTLSTPEAGGTLVFSSVGYISQERAVGAESTFAIALVADVKQLSEIVVTGYGTQERRNVTGSVASVKGEAIANLASPSFAQQLAGRAAGVNVQTPSGLLGQQPRIQIRGTNSISSGTFPLVVVDGQPIFTGNNSTLGAGFTTNPLADINPNDIESYEVLKDGSATAIYGSRAANGVILITTKKGRQGKASVTYDSYLGVAQTLKRYKVLNADEFIAISNEKSAGAAGGIIAKPFLDANGQAVSTDWQKEIFRTGFQQNHVVAVSGATDKVNYYFSGGFTNQDGVVKTNSLQRFSFRSNVDADVKKWMRVGMNLGLTRTQYMGLNSSTNGLSGNVTNATSLFPNVPARNPDGSAYSDPLTGTLGQGNNTIPINFNYPNIIFQLENNTFRSTNYRVLGGTYLEVEPVANLRFRTQLSTDVLLTDDFQFLDPRQGDGRGVNGSVFQNFSPSTRWNWTNTATYNNTFAEVNKVNVVVGVEYQKTAFTSFGANGTNLSARELGLNNIITGTLATPTINGDAGQNGLQSYFGRVNYGFKDRYLLSVTVRSDALSSLPVQNRRGLFPGGSVGWRVSEEPFFKNSAVASVWSDFKIRGSYAQVGNTDIGYFPYASLYGPAKYGSQNGIGYNINGQFGNDNLKWETSKKTDVGVDVGFFSGRINLAADYYRNTIDGAILAVRTPLSLGVPLNSYNANIGALYNEGFEFSLNTQNVRNENFTWSSTFNLSTNKNRVTALNNNEDIIDTYNITRVGESVGSLYGFVYRGVNKANGNPIYLKADGVTMVQGNIDTNGYNIYDPNNEADVSKPASLTSADKKILGQTNPKLFGGLSNTFTYKGFDLDVFLRYNVGNSIMNVTRQQLLRQDFVNNGTEILGRWRESGNVTDVPRLQLGNSAFINNDNNALSRFVESGSFLRVQNVTLGYTFPQQSVGRLNLSRVRLFGQVQNLATLTKYKGVDPEVNSNITSNRQAGIDNNSNPQQRVFTGGVNVAF